MKTRVLTICTGGLVRSAGLSDILRLQDYDSIPLSHKWAGADTFIILSDWADIIIAMEPKYTSRVPLDCQYKVKIMDVGEDIWHNPRHPALVSLIKSKLSGIGL